MMRERYSCRKSIWRWLIISVLLPPESGASCLCLIYHTSITPGACRSIVLAASGRRRGSADDTRHNRVVGGGVRSAAKNDLTALDHVKPVGKIRHVMDVGLGDEERMPEGADIGQALDDRRHDNRRESL